MRATSILIIALICCQSIQAIEMKSQVEVSRSPEKVLMELKSTKWGSLAINMLQMQLKTNGPLEELIVAFRNLYNNLAFKINSENEDYRVMREEHLVIKRENQRRMTESSVRMGVSNSKLQNTLYPDEQTYQNVISDMASLIERTQAATDQATAERQTSQTFFESNMEELDLGIDAIQECMALIRGLQSGTASLAQVKSVKQNTNELIEKIPNTKHNENLVLIKTLMKMTQDFADAGAANRVLSLFEELLQNFLDEKQNLTMINNQEIDLFNNTLEVNNNIIADAQQRKDSATINLERTQLEITEEEGRLAYATSDNQQATADFEQEETRWALEETTHLDLIAQLNDELDALNQIIDLFTSPDMDNIGDDMLDRLNQ